MVRKILPIGVGLAAGALASGYGLAGRWTWTVVILALAGLWLLGQWRGWEWTASVGLVLYVAIAALGLWLDLSPGWMLFGGVATLCAWDLDHFARRLRSAERVEGVRGLERRHLQRLLIVAALGSLSAAIALQTEIRLTFITSALSGLLVVLGLSRAVGFLRRESN